MEVAHPVLSLQDYMYYCEKRDELVWKERKEDQEPDERVRNSFNRRWAGKPVKGSVSTNGYRQVSFMAKTYSYHHLVWYLCKGQWPKLQIDHINRDRLDNRIENLREVSASENCRNIPLKSNNTSGVVGVYNMGNRFVAVICGKHLGSFPTFDAAVDCRKRAELEWGFHENHGK